MNTLKITDKVDPMNLLSFLSISQVEALEADGSIEWLEYQEVFWIHNIDNVLVMKNNKLEDNQQ